MKITDKIQITNEDNMELMARYPDNYFDLAIVDPPYGTEQMWQNGGNTWGKRKEMKEWEIRPNKEYFKELIRVSKNQIIWGGNYFIDYLQPTRCVIVWDKITRNMWADGELAWTSFNSNLKIFNYAKSDAVINHKINLPRIHPTQKPVKLYEFCLHNYAKEGDKILDTHLGSGSIAIACHEYGFELTACELDAEYYDKAVERIKNHVSQQKLF
jgi:site-specific DNA-methyltransferase (adenine-specific)